MKRSDKLPDELASAGASQKEQQDLAEFAAYVQKAPKIERSAEFKTQQARRLYSRLEAAEAARQSRGRFSFMRWFAPALATLLIVPAIATAAAQSSMPGDALYGLKRWSESVAVRVVPSWQDDIALRRSEEVKNLVNSNQNNEQVNKTLRAYEQAVENTRKNNSSTQAPTAASPSPVLQESLQNLEEARTDSEPAVQEEIDQTIRSTEENAQVLPAIPAEPTTPLLP